MATSNHIFGSNEVILEVSNERRTCRWVHRLPNQLKSVSDVCLRWKDAELGCAMFMFLSSSQPSLTKQITEYVFGKLRLTLLSPFSYTVGSLLNFTERVGWKEREENELGGEERKKINVASTLA